MSEAPKEEIKPYYEAVIRSYKEELSKAKDETVRLKDMFLSSEEDRDFWKLIKVPELLDVQKALRDLVSKRGDELEAKSKTIEELVGFLRESHGIEPCVTNGVKIPCRQCEIIAKYSGETGK